MNRFNSDLNMSKLAVHECRRQADPVVDMTLPNHAVNAMFTTTQIIGSVILIILAGPYVNSLRACRTLLMIRWQQWCLAHSSSWQFFSVSTSELEENCDA
jgi:hypothetical protein